MKDNKAVSVVPPAGGWIGTLPQLTPEPIRMAAQALADRVDADLRDRYGLRPEADASLIPVRLNDGAHAVGGWTEE